MVIAHLCSRAVVLQQPRKQQILAVWTTGVNGEDLVRTSTIFVIWHCKTLLIFYFLHTIYANFQECNAFLWNKGSNTTIKLFLYVIKDSYGSKLRSVLVSISFEENVSWFSHIFRCVVGWHLGFYGLVTETFDSLWAHKKSRYYSTFRFLESRIWITMRCIYLIKSTS